MIKLGVNIDHVATIRQARGTQYPSVVQAALRAEQSGADSITLHLREDRRHMQDADVHALRGLLQTRMNLECAVTDEMIAIALKVAPQDVCLVPERREERTTEGGLDVVANFAKVEQAVKKLNSAGLIVLTFRKGAYPIVEIIDSSQRAGRQHRQNSPDQLETKILATSSVATWVPNFRNTNFQKQGYSHEKQTAFNFS